MRPALLALVTVVTTAQAAPGRPVHPDATGDELLALARARIAERTGDLDEAEDLYRRALRMAKHATTYWNLGVIQRRLEKYEDAIRTFEEYKLLATTDAERAAADAEVAAIKATPMRIALSGHEAEVTHVFVDGVRKGTAPQLVTFPAEGRHVIDMMSASGYEHQRIEAKLATADAHRLRGSGSGNRGNVILAGSAAFSSSLSWQVGTHRFSYPGRFTLPPGTYQTTLGGTDQLTCDAFKFTVPKKGTVFVFVAAPTRNKKGCTNATVTTQAVSL